MCHKFLQVYACRHNKTICTTPCPYAIATGHQIPNDNGNTPDLSRSSSVVSSMTPSTTFDVQDLPSQRIRDTQARASPLRTAVLSSQAQQGGGIAPAFRFVAPDTGQETVSAGSPASLSLISPSSNQPSPTFSTTGTLVDVPISMSTSSPSTFLSPANPEIDNSTVEPNFCAYHFPRHLLHSRVPCLGCYSRPEWEKQREGWMKAYREQHPGFMEEDVEKLSGVTTARERFGE